MMIVQILFRKIFDTIGDNTWGLPGLTFGELRRIYLPIYWFALGASIVDMAERVEVRNLALASSLCLALPPLIR